MPIFDFVCYKKFNKINCFFLEKEYSQAPQNLYKSNNGEPLMVRARSGPVIYLLLLKSTEQQKKKQQQNKRSK